MVSANLQLFLATLSMFVGENYVQSCTARNHPHLLKKLPQIFTFSKDKVQSDKVCRKQMKVLAKSDREYVGCSLVDIHLEAFLAPTASLCLHPPAEMTNDVEDGDTCSRLVLVKQTEQGLDLLMGSGSSQATAQVSYGSTNGGVAFTIKADKVFGAIGEKTENRQQFYSLEPCLGIKKCHLLLQIIKKH